MLVSPTAPTTAFQLGDKLDDPMAMYLNDIATIPANLAGVPGMSLPSGLADEDGLPAGIQLLAPAHGGRAALRRRRRPGGDAAASAGAARCWTARPSWRWPDERAGPGLRRGRRAVRPGARARGPHRAQHHDQDVLRLRHGVRRRAEHPGLPGLPRPARRPAGRQREGASSRRSGSAWRCTAPSRRGAASRGRTTSTRTCRRTSRPASTTSRSPSTGTSTSSWTTARRSGSRSSAPTWRRTPASRCTSAARPAGSTAPTTRWSTTTAPASR